MFFNAYDHLDAVERSALYVHREGEGASAVTLTRTLAVSADDLWDALTNSERIAKWFSPVTGDLKEGGQYQVQDNASGTITSCYKPSHFGLTWEVGGEISWVEIQLLALGDDYTRLTLIHTSRLTDHWRTYGPGAVGVGWEMGLMSLAIHVERPGQARIDEAEFAASEGGQEFISGSSSGWERAWVAAGEDADSAREGAARTTAFYTGEATDS